MSNPNDTRKTASQTGRQTLWVWTAISSTIALIAITKYVHDLGVDVKVSDQPRSTKWAVSGISIIFLVSVVTAIANAAIEKRFVGTMIEGVVVSHLARSIFAFTLTSCQKVF